MQCPAHKATPVIRQAPGATKPLAAFAEEASGMIDSQLQRVVGAADKHFALQLQRTNRDDDLERRVAAERLTIAAALRGDPPLNGAMPAVEEPAGPPPGVADRDVAEADVTEAADGEGDATPDANDGDEAGKP